MSDYLSIAEIMIYFGEFRLFWGNFILVLVNISVREYRLMINHGPICLYRLENKLDWKSFQIKNLITQSPCYKTSLALC